ncbi:MAG TPA: spore germination protein [Firmicutes bacterium]|nr:spore germination protein [Candidatus Fermentithermobacillaceae bacterium]
MKPFSFVKRLIWPRRASSLGRTGKPGIPGGGEDIVRGKYLERPPYATPQAKEAERDLWSTTGGQWGKPSRPDSNSPPRRSPFGAMSQEKRKILASDISTSLDRNLEVVMDIFHAPRNGGLIIRGIEVRTDRGPVRVALVYMEGLIDGDTIKDFIISPLNRLNTLDKPVRFGSETALQHIAEAQVYTARKYSQVVMAIVEGECVIFIDGEREALTADTRAISHRQVEESPTEAVVRGPHEGFVENLRENIALIRRRLSTPDLVAERHFVGARSHTPVDIVYLEGVVNPKLVDEVRKAIDSISVDLVPAGDVSKWLQPVKWFPFPTHITTERPDRASAMIAEGHIAIVNDSPNVLLVPATIIGLMNSAEDYYVHPVPASLLRMIRYFAFFVTLYASAMYVAITTFHPEMIPTELMFAIASAREIVPFPTAVEVVLMEIAFELIREAGVRIPSVIGPTIGIVGAVVLGQAAVQASIVSPIPVVVVSVSGLGSFAIPNYDLSLFARTVRFLLILVAAIFGIPGLTLVSLILLAELFSVRSLGQPITAPVIPAWRRNLDDIFLAPLPKLTRRPAFLRTQEVRSADERPSAETSPEGPAPANEDEGG